MTQTVRLPAASQRPAGPMGWLMEDSMSGMARRKALLGYVFYSPRCWASWCSRPGRCLARLEPV